MGLDVYLYKCPDIKYAAAMEEAYEAELSKIYDEWGKIDDKGTPTKEQEEEFNNKRAAAREKYGIDGYSHKSRIQIHLDSKTEPEHLFKIGYMRSSYNSNGINRIADVFDLPDLYSIFEVDNDEYYQEHDWDTIYVNIKQAIEKWQAHVDGPWGKYGVHQFRPSWRPDDGVGSEHEALERFNIEYLSKKEEIDKDDWKKSGWCSSHGEFYPQPLKVVAMISRVWDSTKPSNYHNWPNTFVVYERDDTSVMDWYVTALKIVQEMIEWILEQEDKDQYIMGWSG